jgi:hypothetical protein
MLEAVQDDVITIGQNSFELDVFAGIFASHSLEIFYERLLAVAHSGIVLNVFSTDVLLDSFGWSALIEHEVIEDGHVLLVVLKMILHLALDSI